MSGFYESCFEDEFSPQYCYVCAPDEAVAGVIYPYPRTPVRISFSDLYREYCHKLELTRPYAGLHLPSPTLEPLRFFPVELVKNDAVINHVTPWFLGDGRFVDVRPAGFTAEQACYLGYIASQLFADPAVLDGRTPYQAALQAFKAPGCIDAFLQRENIVPMIRPEDASWIGQAVLDEGASAVACLGRCDNNFAAGFGFAARRQRLQFLTDNDYHRYDLGRMEIADQIVARASRQRLSYNSVRTP